MMQTIGYCTTESLGGQNQRSVVIYSRNFVYNVDHILVNSQMILFDSERKYIFVPFTYLTFSFFMINEHKEF